MPSIACYPLLVRPNRGDSHSPFGRGYPSAPGTLEQLAGAVTIIGVANMDVERAGNLCFPTVAGGNG
jgi:hypothetical protein